jgi:glutaredoxin 3
MAPNVEIYIWTTCPFCIKAKRLLDSKGVQYTEYNRTGGRKSVPQIFIDGNYIGGCDDVHALDRAGKLEPMLAGV